MLLFHHNSKVILKFNRREKPGCDEYVELEAMKVPLLLNYSLCLMKTEEFYEAITHLTSVLKIEPGL